MKKYIKMFIVGMMIFSLVGCSNGVSKNEASSKVNQKGVSETVEYSFENEDGSTAIKKVTGKDGVATEIVHTDKIPYSMFENSENKETEKTDCIKRLEDQERVFKGKAELLQLDGIKHELNTKGDTAIFTIKVDFSNFSSTDYDKYVTYCDDLNIKLQANYDNDKIKSFSMEKIKRYLELMNWKKIR